MLPGLEIVAVEAKRLDGAASERIPIAVVRLDVIGMPGAGHDASGEAHRAKRIQFQLQPGAAIPDGAIIPMGPGFI